MYLAESAVPGRRVALKVLAPEIAAEPVFRERFADESRIAASIDHPNIIPIYEAGDAGGVLFLAMRYVGGPDLRTLLYREGPLRPDRAVRILGPIADALDAAHAVGLVRRDVNSASILVSARDDHPYLSDFGAHEAHGRLRADADRPVPRHAGLHRARTGPDRQGRRAGGSVLAGVVAFAVLSELVPHERETDLAALFAHPERRRLAGF